MQEHFEDSTPLVLLVLRVFKENFLGLVKRSHLWDLLHLITPYMEIYARLASKPCIEQRIKPLFVQTIRPILIQQPHEFLDAHVAIFIGVQNVKDVHCFANKAFQVSFDPRLDSLYSLAPERPRQARLHKSSPHSVGQVLYDTF